MPGFNETGPKGQGAMTGRGLGRCANASAPTNENVATPEVTQERDLAAFGNRGNGMGCGRGRRCMDGLGRQARFGGRR